MDEIERSKTIGEVVTPTAGGEERDASAQTEGEKGIGAADRSGQNGQSHEENHRYQAARRGGERAGYDRAKKELDERIAAAGVKNAAGKTIRTIEELEAWQKEAKTSETAKAETMQDIWRAAEEAQSFADRFPGVDKEELQRSAGFRKFCGSRLGREPIAELYTDYLELTDAAKAPTESKQESKRERNTGSGSAAAGGGLSGTQQKELDAWNRAYPSMRMTQREFLSRK